MKILLLAVSVLLLSASAKKCGHKNSEFPDGCFKGKLEVKAACMNYTISVTGGGMDPTRIQASWTDESTGKPYRNVFALGSRCTFPDTIKEGDEFYFTIDSTSPQNCAVCMIYYPVPAKHLSIKVLNVPCK
jgi:hypothetical protein